MKRIVPLAVALALLPGAARALPSFTAQTGAACTACHTTAFGPSLTPYGEDFKRLGYSLGKTASGEGGRLPLNLLAVASFSETAASQAAPPAGFEDNANAALDTLSVVYAGKLAEPVGALVEVAYDGVAHEARWGKLDVRWAGANPAGAPPLSWGVSLNNGPAVQDLWNTSPAWTFPFRGSGVAPSPAASPLIERRLAGEVYGLSGYSRVLTHLYAELGGYRSLPGELRDTVGAHSRDRIDRLAPYWRLAGLYDRGPDSFRLGAFGMRTALCPDDDCSLGTDDYFDFAYDATWLWRGEDSSLKLQASYTQEAQHLDASVARGAAANARNRLLSYRASALLALGPSVSLTASAFRLEGTDDALLYAPAPDRGSVSGSPASDGLVLEAAYGTSGRPVTDFLLHYRLGLQATLYSSFNGAHSNYDGFGRDAADNDTLFAYLWIAI